MSINYAAAMQTVKTVNIEEKKSDSKFIRTSTFGNKIRLRFMPDWKTISKTKIMTAAPYHHVSHKWHSSSGRLYIYNCLKNAPNSPKCPMCDVGFTEYKSQDAIIRKRAKELLPVHEYHVNVYVVSDLKCPENNGKVMILRMGKKLYDTYLSATTGDFSSVYGDKIWNLGEGGCTFLLICEKGGVGADGRQFPTYEKSSFLPVEASNADVVDMTDDKINELCEQVYELPLLFPIPTVATLKAALDSYYYGAGEYSDDGGDGDDGDNDPGDNDETEGATTPSTPPATNVNTRSEPEPPPVERAVSATPSASVSGTQVSDDELNALLGI